MGILSHATISGDHYVDAPAVIDEPDFRTLILVLRAPRGGFSKHVLAQQDPDAHGVFSSAEPLVRRYSTAVPADRDLGGFLVAASPAVSKHRVAPTRNGRPFAAAPLVRGASWQSYEDFRASARGALDRVASWISGVPLDDDRNGTNSLDASISQQEGGIEDGDEVDSKDAFVIPAAAAPGTSSGHQRLLNFEMQESTTVCKNGRCHTVTRHLLPRSAGDGGFLDLRDSESNAEMPNTNGDNGMETVEPSKELEMHDDELLGGWPALGGSASAAPAPFGMQTEANW